MSSVTTAGVTLIIDPVMARGKSAAAQVDEAGSAPGIRLIPIDPGEAPVATFSRVLNFAPHRWWLLIAAVDTPGLSTVKDSYRTVIPISRAFPLVPACG